MLRSFSSVDVQRIVITALTEDSIYSVHGTNGLSVSASEDRPTRLRCTAIGGYPDADISLHLGVSEDIKQPSLQISRRVTWFEDEECHVVGLRRLTNVVELITEEFHVDSSHDELPVRCVATATENMTSIETNVTLSVQCKLTNDVWFVGLRVLLMFQPVSIVSENIFYYNIVFEKLGIAPKSGPQKLICKSDDHDTLCDFISELKAHSFQKIIRTCACFLCAPKFKRLSYYCAVYAACYRSILSSNIQSLVRLLSPKSNTVRWCWTLLELCLNQSICRRWSTGHYRKLSRGIYTEQQRSRPSNFPNRSLPTFASTSFVKTMAELFVIRDFAGIVSCYRIYESRQWEESGFSFSFGLCLNLLAYVKCHLRKSRTVSSMFLCFWSVWMSIWLVFNECSAEQIGQLSNVDNRLCALPMATNFDWLAESSPVPG